MVRQNQATKASSVATMNQTAPQKRGDYESDGSAKRAPHALNARSVSSHSSEASTPQLERLARLAWPTARVAASAVLAESRPGSSRWRRRRCRPPGISPWTDQYSALAVERYWEARALLP